MSSSAVQVPSTLDLDLRINLYSFGLGKKVNGTYHAALPIGVCAGASHHGRIATVHGPYHQLRPSLAWLAWATP
jgi:hypothetical protein